MRPAGEAWLQIPCECSKTQLAVARDAAVCNKRPPAKALQMQAPVVFVTAAGERRSEIIGASPTRQSLAPLDFGFGQEQTSAIKTTIFNPRAWSVRAAASL